MAAGGPAGASVSPAYQPMAGSVPSFATASQVTGATAGAQKLTFQVWMKPDLAAAYKVVSDAAQKYQ